MTTNRTVTSKIRELLYRLSARLLSYYYEGPPPLIFTCIGFNFIRTSKEKQKVILQVEKLGFRGLYIFFISVLKHRLRVLVNEAVLTRGKTQCFEQK